jgi:hypothetical protein
MRGGAIEQEIGSGPADRTKTTSVARGLERPEPMAKLIVRRGMRPEYYGFLTMTAVANGDEVIVDRRRRNGSDPAEVLHPGFPDRRGPRSERWIDDDVIVVDGPQAAPEFFLGGD